MGDSNADAPAFERTGRTEITRSVVDCLPMDTQVADNLLGSLIEGRYHVHGRVARGGMATVYTATDERLERTVAIKIIHPAHARDPQFVDRFIDEAKTIARLSHPNVVAIYDQGNHGGLPYLVMEYVRGRTLREILADRGRLSAGEALAILEQTLAAIAAAHRAGLIHRDVKPENMLVAEAPTGGPDNLLDAVVKVADFGLARAVEASADDGSSGQLLATVAYVAPELVTDGYADARTDVYSAGIVLFEMLTGRVPYQGERPIDVAWQHVDRDVPPPSRFVPGLPPALDELVARATRRDPGDRPTDAGALLTQVQAIRDDIGAANASTSVMRPLAQPTVTVAPVAPADRPSWARLPDTRSGSRGTRTGTRPGGSAYSGHPAHSAPGHGPERGTVVVTRTPWPNRVRKQIRDVHQRILAHPQGRLAMIAAMVAVVLLISVGAWWFGFGRYTAAPEFVSLNKADAVSKAQRGGFELKYDDGRYDEKVQRDTVMAQQPVAGARILKGGTVTLTLSLGPERYKVPDVIGKTYELAVVDLQKIKAVPNRQEKYDDNTPQGAVLSVDPPVGKEVAPNQKITVWVSRGKAPLTVPNVIGKQLSEVQPSLQAMGLIVTTEEKDSDKPKGTIIDQSPQENAGVTPGTQIKLTVSKGPAQVAVPDLVSPQTITCAAGQQILQQSGLVGQPIGNPAGIIRAQQPAPNTPVDRGSTVTLLCP